ncbi:hypothetical protein V6N13_060346 [Hibiscus sabdariffa]|uniref:Uncharacterized protein n=1 Tax=Hibiscus sabdariffa TaxID=183260 RepID=A0ABR2GAN2_9ROSI
MVELFDVTGGRPLETLTHLRQTLVLERSTFTLENEDQQIVKKVNHHDVCLVGGGSVKVSDMDGIDAVRDGHAPWVLEPGLNQVLCATKPSSYAAIATKKLMSDGLGVMRGGLSLDMDEEKCATSGIMGEGGKIGNGVQNPKIVDGPSTEESYGPWMLVGRCFREHAMPRPQVATRVSRGSSRFAALGTNINDEEVVEVPRVESEKLAQPGELMEG